MALFSSAQVSQKSAGNGGGSVNISERLSNGWVDAWTVCMLVVEPRVQQGETFMVSNIPLFSRDGLIPVR